MTVPECMAAPLIPTMVTREDMKSVFDSPRGAPADPARKFPKQTPLRLAWTIY